MKKCFSISVIGIGVVLLLGISGCEKKRPVIDYAGITKREVLIRKERPLDKQVATLLEEEQLNLAKLFEIADRQNPRLIAAREAFQAAEGRVKQAALHPNPELDLSQSRINPVDEGATGVFLSLPIIIGDRRTAAVVREMLAKEWARWELERERRTVFEEVHQAWIDLMYYRELGGLEQDLLEHAEASASFAKEQQATGSMLESQALRASIAERQIDLEVTRAVANSVYAFQRLETVLGGVGIKRSQVQGRLLTEADFSISTMAEEWVEEHPDYAAGATAVTVQEAILRVAKAERVPDITRRAGVSQDWATDELSIGVGVTIPLPILDRNQGRILEADRQIRKSRAQLEEVRLRLLNELKTNDQLLNEYDTFVSDYTTTLVPMALESFRAAKADIRDAKMTFDEFLQIQETYFEAERTLVQNRYDLTMADAQRRHLLGYDEMGDVRED